MGRRKRAATDRHMEVVSARVRAEIYRSIEEIAKEEDLTITQIVRRFITSSIKAYQKKAA